MLYRGSSGEERKDTKSIDYLSKNHVVIISDPVPGAIRISDAVERIYYYYRVQRCEACE